MSLYLFLLVMEGVRRPMNVAKMSNGVHGIYFREEVSVTHTLFVDDACLFLGNSGEEDKEMKEILDNLCKAIGIVINYGKYACFHNLLEVEN